MKIYIINKNGQVLNVSNSHLEVRESFGGKWNLVGLVEDMSGIYRIEEFCSEECARGVLEEIIEEIKYCTERYTENVVIDLRKECKCDGKSEQCEEKHKDTEGNK